MNRIIRQVTFDGGNRRKEEWKWIPGYEGYYQASTKGNIRSVDRIVKCANNSTRTSKGKIIKQFINQHGYYQLRLNKNGGGKTFKVHQIIAITFLNHTPNGHKFVVDHIDNNPLNNNLQNLQIITKRRNSIRSPKRGKYSNYPGVTFCKLKNKWVSRIKYNGTTKNLGYFNEEIDAYNAYRNRLNIIENE